jgi:hypothetical protein
MTVMQMLFHNKVFFLILMFGLSGCSDDWDRSNIGSTEYRYVNHGGYQQFLSGDDNVIAVLPSILGYFKYENNFFFVRQIVNELRCIDGSSRDEITKSIEYWLLDDSESSNLFSFSSESELVSQLSRKGISAEGIAKVISRIEKIESKYLLDVSGQNSCT